MLILCPTPRAAKASRWSDRLGRVVDRRGLAGPARV